MTAATTVPPMVGLRAVKLPLRGLEATSQWGVRVFGWQRRFDLPDEGVDFRARGAP